MMTVDIEPRHLPQEGFRYRAGFAPPRETTRACDAACHLRIAPVPGVETLGVFNVGGTIPCSSVLGVYVGDVGTEQDEDSDYAFRVNDFIIDSTRTGNWTRFVNTSSGFEEANVWALDSHDLAEVGLPTRLRDYETCFVASRDIAPGEQLRFYYGVEYELEGLSAGEIDAVATRRLPDAVMKRHGGELLVLERAGVRRTARRP